MEETQHLKSEKLATIINKIPNSTNQIRLSSTNGHESLTLFTDSIRRINNGEHTTYTFPIKQVDPTKTEFQNFILDVRDSTVTTFLATYTPDSIFLSHMIKNQPSFYSGRVKLDLYEPKITNTIQPQAIKIRLQTCTTILVSEVYYTLCQGGEDGVHHTYAQGNACNGFDGPNGAKMYTYSTPVTTCETINLPGGGGTGGNNGGGGGGGGPTTPPTTPPGYNPCSPPPVAVASAGGIKTNLVEGGCPVNNPEDSPGGANFFRFGATGVTIKIGTRPCVNSIFSSLQTQALIASTVDAALRNGGSSYVGVADMISKISFDPNWNVTIEEKVIYDQMDSNGENIFANATTIPKFGSANLIVNSNYLNKATDIAVARTIIHEMIHSYFILAMSNPLDPNLQAFKNANSLLYDKSGNALTDQNGESQHSQMANSYVDGIAKLLLIYAESNDIQSPDPSVSLSSYCHDLAWGALQYTPAYKHMPFADKSRIERNIIKENNHSTGSTTKKGC